MPTYGLPDLALQIFRLAVIWPVGFILLRFVPTRLGLAMMKRLRLDVRAAWEWERLNFLSDKRLSNSVRIWRLHFWAILTRPGLGLAWGCAMEASFRIYALAWFAMGPNKTSLNVAQIARVAALIRRESQFVAANLETHSFNNHYAFNVFGLLIAHMVTPGDDAKWQAELNRVLRAQFLPDGANFEASTSYHLLMLEALARLVILRPELRPVVKTAMNLSGALAFAEHVAPDGKLIWRIGDTDGSCVVRDGCTVTELMKEADCVPQFTKISRTDFKDFGATFLGNGTLSVALWVPSPGQNGRAGHNHADALTLTCAVNNHAIIGDPGVPLYSFMRNWFRSAQLHSGPFPVGYEPLNQAGSFRTDKHWRGSLHRVSLNEAVAKCERIPGEGYRRQVKMVSGPGVEVVDSVAGQLPPPCPKLLIEPAYSVTLEGPLRARLKRRDGKGPDLVVEALEGIVAFRLRRSWYATAYFRLSTSKKLSMESISTNCRWRVYLA